MIKEIKKVEAVVVYGVDLRQWKGKVLKGNLIALGVEFKKSSGALVIEANDENVAEIERLVYQGNYKYVVDVAVEYVEVEEAEATIEAGTKVKVVAEVSYKGFEGVVVGEGHTSRTDGKKCLIVEVEKVGRKYLEVEEVEAVDVEQEEHLLNMNTKVISKEGDQKGGTYVRVYGREVEVEGGFAFVGTTENGEVVEAFLSEGDYFNGKEFIAGTKSPRTLIQEGKALEVEARTMNTEEAIKTINTYLEEVEAIVNKVLDNELRYELRDVQNPLKWYVYNLEDMVERQQLREKAEANRLELAKKVEEVLEAPAWGTKVKVVCLEGSKNFTRRTVYKGTVHGMKGHYKLIGDDGKSHIVRAERFALREKEVNKPKLTNKEKVQQFAEKEGLVLGCWNSLLEDFTEASLKHVLGSIDVGSATDIVVRNNLQEYVVSVDFVDNEIDFTLWTKTEYISIFGEEKFIEEF